MKHTTIAIPRANQSYAAFYFFLLLLASQLIFSNRSLGSPLKGFTTATHVGYAVNQDSSTGFSGVGGSLLFLDLLHSAGSDFEVGMRTIAQGGEESRNEYYRMGVGPVVSWNVSTNWRAQLSLSFFNETGSDDSREQAYKSRGRSYQIGWERCRELMKNVEVAWGGFYMMHHGNIDLSERPTTTATSSRYANISSNTGSSRGVEFSLRLRL